MALSLGSHFTEWDAACDAMFRTRALVEVVCSVGHFREVMLRVDFGGG